MRRKKLKKRSMQKTTWQADNTINEFQHVGTLKYNKVFTTRGHTCLTCRLCYQRIVYKYKCLSSFSFSFLSSFFKLRGRENMQLQNLAFWRVPSESIFSFTGWRIYLYSSGLKAQVLLVQDSFRFFTRSLARDYPHLFTATSLFKTYSSSYFRRGGYFRFRILANHLASFFFSPCQAIR